MINLTTLQIDGDLKKNQTVGAVNAIQQLESLNSGKQDLKLLIRDVVGPLAHGLEIIHCAHSTANVDLLTEISGDNGPVAAIITAAGKPGSRIAGFGSTITLSANGPYPSGTKASAISSDDMVIYQTLSELTGRRKTILDFIVSGTKLSAADAKRCGIVDKIAQFKNKYSKKNSLSTLPPTPGTPAPVAPAPVKKRGRPKASPEVNAVA